MNEWLRVSKYTEAISSIEMMAEQSEHLSSDLYRWKWFIISLHNALQCFMVLSLHKLNPLPILRKDDAKKWLKAYHEGSNKLNDYKLDNFLNLYTKIKNQDNSSYNLRVGFYQPRDTEDWSVERLSDYRNIFVHFIPCGMSLSIANLVRVGSDSLGIIKHLGWHTDRIKFARGDSKRAQAAINKAISNINKLIDQYQLKVIKQELIEEESSPAR